MATMNRRSILSGIGAALGAGAAPLLIGPAGLADDNSASRSGRDLVRDGSPSTLLVANGRILTGHESVVTATSLNEDGSRAASGGEDGTLCVWDTADGRLLAKFASLGSAIVSLAMSPDGSLLAACCRSGFRAINVLEGSGRGVDVAAPVASIPRAPAPSRTSIVRKGGILKIFDVATSTQARILEDDVRLFRAVAFAARGALVIAIDDHGALNAWSTRNGRPIFGVEARRPIAGGPVARRAGYSFSQSSPRAASISGISEVIVSGSTEPGGRVFRCGDEPLYCVAITPDGRRFATADRDHRLTIRSSDRGITVGLHQPGADARPSGVPSALAFSPDGERFASGSEGGVVQIWDVGRERPIGMAKGPDEFPVTSLTFGPGCLKVLAGRHRDGEGRSPYDNHRGIDRLTEYDVRLRE